MGKIYKISKRVLCYNTTLLVDVYRNYSRENPNEFNKKLKSFLSSTLIRDTEWYNSLVGERALSDKYFMTYLRSQGAEITKENKKYYLSFHTTQDEFLFCLRHM